MQQFSSLVHMGMPKCASTFLQKKFFPKSDKLLYLGKFDKEPYLNTNYPNQRKCEELLNAIMDFDDIKSITQEHVDFMKRLEKEASSKNKLLCLSEENISSIPMVMTVLYKLKKCFTNPLLLLVIRNQVNVLESMYSYKGGKIKFTGNSKGGRYLPIEEWLEDYVMFNASLPKAVKNYNIEANLMSAIDYRNYVHFIEVFFPRKNILIVPYEYIKSSPAKFYSHISNKIGMDLVPKGFVDDNELVNKSPNGNQIFWTRLKQSIPLFRNKNFGLLSNRVVISIADKLIGTQNNSIEGDYLNRINNYYSASNEWLSKEFDLNLKEIGYPHR